MLTLRQSWQWKIPLAGNHCHVWWHWRVTVPSHLKPGAGCCGFASPWLSATPFATAWVGSRWCCNLSLCALENGPGVPRSWLIAEWKKTTNNFGKITANLKRLVLKFCESGFIHGPTGYRATNMFGGNWLSIVLALYHISFPSLLSISV